jgi:hypothetical protein
MFQNQDQEPLSAEEFQFVAALAKRVQWLEAQGRLDRDSNRALEVAAIRWVFSDLLGMTVPATAPRSTPEVYQRVDRGDR